MREVCGISMRGIKPPPRRDRNRDTVATDERTDRAYEGLSQRWLKTREDYGGLREGNCCQGYDLFVFHRSEAKSGHL